MSYGGYPDLKNIRKILVVKLRHLGDVLLTAPVFRVLKQALPQARVDAYIYREAFPMLEGHPAIDRLIGYDRNWKKLNFLGRVRKELGLLQDIRSQGYDLVVNLTEGDRGVLAAKVSGAKIRVGMRPKGKRQQSWLTHIAKDCPSPRHAVEKNLDVLRRIGIFPRFEDRELDFHLPEAVRQRVLLFTGGSSFVLIHPTSRWRFKCWPIVKMRALIAQLILFGKKVVLTSGPDPIEMEMSSQIAEGMDVLNLAGQVTLKELGALIDASEMLICVDSVPLHLASALKHPVIAIFGPTSDVAWGPWRNPHATIVASAMSCRPCYLDGCGGSKRSDCLESLSVDAVLQAVYALNSKIFTEVGSSSLRVCQELIDRT